jgi:hypothetical protein
MVAAVETPRKKLIRRTATAHGIASLVSSATMNALQWPAMAVTLLAAYWVASQRKQERQRAFWLYLFSNVLWIAWGWHEAAYAVVCLQIGLAVLNLRGVEKNEVESQAGRGP